MAKIIFKILVVTFKVILMFLGLCGLISAGAITWSGIKEAWIGDCRDIRPLVDEYM